MKRRATPGTRVYKGRAYVERLVRLVQPGDTVALHGAWRTVVALQVRSYGAGNRNCDITYMLGEQQACVARAGHNPIRVALE